MSYAAVKSRKMAAVFRFCYKVLGCSCSWDSHQCYASIADAATKASVLCFVLSFWSSVHPYFSARNLCPTPTPKMFVLLHKNSNKISVKLTGANHYHELIKWLYFWWNWKRDNGAGYDRMLESWLLSRGSDIWGMNSQISLHRLRQMQSWTQFHIKSKTSDL